MATVDIPADFGFVILTAIASMFTLIWLGIKVGGARKKYGIEYPQMYSNDKEGPGHMFNCYQRAHGNTLEVFPTFLVLLLLGGMYSPRLSAACGLVWIFSRIVYAQGYYTGDPAKRNLSAFGYIGLLTLLGNTGFFACHLLGWYSLY